MNQASKRIIFVTAIPFYALPMAPKVMIGSCFWILAVSCKVMPSSGWLDCPILARIESCFFLTRVGSYMPVRRSSCLHLTFRNAPNELVCGYFSTTAAVHKVFPLPRWLDEAPLAEQKPATSSQSYAGLSLLGSLFRPFVFNEAETVQ